MSRPEPIRTLFKRLRHSPALLSFMTLVLAVVALLGIDSVDRSGSAQPTNLISGGRDTTSAAVVANDARGPHRVLVLIVDGLRYETALDSNVMPNLQRLRKQGASGKLETVFEGFSVPAIKAAFTGTAETQLVNVVRNFRFSSLPLESVFLDAERAGKRVLIVGDEPFRQFGTLAERRVPPARANMYAEDAARPAMALSAWQREGFDVVVCHYETTDWRAHEFGIHAPQYRTAFHTADSIVTAFAAARQPNDYLVVFGDHGHNAAGEHKTGIYIPSYALMLGPDVKSGAEFASLDIGNIRLLLSHALGIRLHNSAYQTETVSAFLPVTRDVQQLSESSLAPGSAQPVTTAGQDVRAWLGLLLFLVVGGSLGLAISQTAGGSARLPLVLIAVMVAELLAQQLWSPVFSLFPWLVLASGMALLRRSRWRGAVVLVIGTFFLTRWVMTDGALSMRVPVSMLSLVPLYVLGTVARLVLFLQLLGRKRWALAALLTALLTVVCVRVWDSPALSIGAILLAATGAFCTRRSHDRALFRVLLVTLGYLLLYYMVRLPIYQLFWIDLFLLAAGLCYRRVPDAWFNALILCGAFTITSVWLSTGLEWGFLYGLMPAYTLERHVVWFLPLIAFKIPLLLVLASMILGWRPHGNFVLLAFVYASLRFVTAWLARLAGANTADIWPIAEQGLYLVPFVIAALVLNGAAVTTSHANPSATPDRTGQPLAT